MEDRLRAVARAAGAHAHGDAGLAGEELGEAGLAHLVERGDVLDARHRPPSFRSLSTSRMSACSFTWPRMAWSTSTTGARAHWPKQATVRIVNRRSGVVRVSLSAPPASSGERERPSCSFSRSRRAREPRVWQAVPRQMAHGVRALGLEVEERVEGGDAVDLRLGDAGPRGHVLERLHGEVPVAVLLLQLLEHAQERAGAAALLRNDAVEEILVLHTRQRRRQAGGHRRPPSAPRSAGRGTIEWPHRRAAIGTIVGFSGAPGDRAVCTGMIQDPMAQEPPSCIRCTLGVPSPAGRRITLDEATQGRGSPAGSASCS